MEPNYADIQRLLDTNPPQSMCWRLGNTHAAYGWAANHQGNFTDEQRAAYTEGYNAYKPKEII